jgi:hypothetical protein
VTTAFLRYTLLRLALFAVVLAGLAAAGARGLLLLALSLASSMALSYLLLRRQRDALATAIAERAEQRRAAEPEDAGADRRPARGLAADEAAEDAEADAIHAARRSAN